MGELFPREMIESVRPEIMIEFLAPFAAYCEARGVRLDCARAKRDTDAFVDDVYALLNTSTRDPKGREFRAAVDAVTHLADDEGELQIQDALVAVKAPHRLTHCELALWAYTRHPIVFERALARKRRSPRQSFREYLPRDRRPIVGASSADVRRILHERLSARHGELGHSRYADVRVIEDLHEVRIFWIHGRGMESVGAIKSDDEREVQRLLRDRCDLTFIDRATGRLSVNTLKKDQAGFLGRTLGETFFADAHHYRNTAIYTGDPIFTHGKAALSTDGVPGIEQIKVRRLEIFRPDKARLGFAPIEDECVLDGCVEDIAAAARIPGAFVMTITFEIRYTRDHHLRTFDLEMSNVIKFDRSIAERSLRQFLVLRGFADYGSTDDWKLAA